MIVGMSSLKKNRCNMEIEVKSTITKHDISIWLFPSLRIWKGFYWWGINLSWLFCNININWYNKKYRREKAEFDKSNKI